MIKRIIAISNHSFIVGGGEKSFLDLLYRLNGPWDLLAVVPGKDELNSILRQKRIRKEVIPLPSIKPRYALDIILSFKRFFNLFRKYRPALIYANGSRAMFYGGVIGRTLKIPVIWHCRISEHDIYLDPLLCRLSSKIIANSKATAKRFQPHFQYKVRTVYNGIDIGWLQNDAVRKPELIKSEWKVILIVARVSKLKRHDLALSAFEKIALSDPRLHLVCVGAKDQLEPEWYDYLMERTKLSKFSDRIHWIGPVADVRPWYKSADLLLLPSEKESFGRVLIEAMACGVPVVATQVGGVSEIINNGQNGLLVPMNNMDEMADALLQIISRRSLRDKIIQNGKERANEFSMEIHIKGMNRVFAETING